MDTPEAISLAGLAVAVVALVARELHASFIERRRTQPVVIAHEERAPLFNGSYGGWVAKAYLTNEGGGAAFNVRFGIEMADVRYAFRLETNDPPEGNIQRVVGAGARIPTEDSVPILITSAEMAGSVARSPGARLDAASRYWCTYENASGSTWETL